MKPELTKREYFALKIYQGMCSGRTEHESPSPPIDDAIELADIFIEKLKI